MAKVVQTTLQISENNVEQYCIADGLSLNTGGYAIRLYLNGHTQGSAILNDAAKEVLYPSATAHPFKIDSTIRANKSGGSMTISLQFDGTSVQSETGDWGSKLKDKIKVGISDPVVINSNRSTEIKWHIKGSSTVSRFSIASTRLTFYFNQYEMRPLVGDNANGIQKVTVSNASPCQGDTVTFTPKLVNGATWDGWYSDAACTNLVSTEQNYSVSPSSDITLYAKATIDATLYNVSAVAGSEVTSVSVSDSIVPDGSTAIFTAQVNEGCSFEAWYSDDTYTTVVSTENPYTATITANTTLYAKAHRNSLNMSVGSAEHGTASVSATTVPYGNNVTFTFTPEDDTWELYGWYSDEGLTQLVSESNPYTFTATEGVTLYPKIGKKRYEINVEWINSVAPSYATVARIVSVDYNELTQSDLEKIRNGSYDSISSNAVFGFVEKTYQISGGKCTISLNAPIGSTVSMYAYHSANDYNNFIPYFKENGETVSSGNVYMFMVDAAHSFNLGLGNRCDCSAITGDGVDYAYAFPEKAVQEKSVEFEAEVASGYTFSGWYSDEACTTLVSTDNPAYVTTPKYTTEDVSTTTLTLYAKAIKATYTIRVGTADHCTTSVSATTAQYGDEVTFSCVVDEGYEFNGWYSDLALTQLVSEANPYTFTATEDTTLYPKIGKKRYTIKYGRARDLIAGGKFKINIIVVDFNSLTRDEINCLRTGDYDSIDPSKIVARDSISDSNALTDSWKTIQCTYDMYVAVYLPEVLGIDDEYDYSIVKDGNGNSLTYWPYYWFQPTADATISSVSRAAKFWCNCSAVAKDGIAYAYATTPTMQEYGAIFEAEVSSGYTFSGWYSNEACTKLVSTDNPANVVTPKYTTNHASQTSLTLYAKATPLSSTTGIYLKRNGSWIKAKSVFKKTNGAWVEQEDLSAIFSGESSGTASNYVYGGSV